MKSVKISLALLVIFSLFLIVYFNTLSLAIITEPINVKVDPEVYKQLEEREKINVILNLNKNFDSEDINQIVKYSKNNIKQLSEEIESKGEKLEIIHAYEAFNSISVKTDKKTLQTLKNSQFIEEIFAEKTLEIQLMESMPLINATQAWNVQVPYGLQTTNLTGLGQVVCLIDTGIDYNSSLLGGAWGVKVIGGYDFVNNDSDPKDDNGHGTHLAGIIAAKGMVGTQPIRGVAPDALLVSEKVCGNTGTCTNTNMLAGINHCMTTIGIKKLSVISMSIGDLQSYNSTTCPTWMDSAINTAVSYGIPVVVSAGNQGFKNGISYPACSPNATSVGATYDKNTTGSVFWNNTAGMPGNSCTDNPVTVDKVACGSNSGPDLDLMAPGATITSAATSSGFNGACGNSGSPLTGCRGTSQSAAHVAGAVALIKQKYFGTIKNNYSGWARIEKILKRGTQKTVTDTFNGITFPRLSLEKLL